MGNTKIRSIDRVSKRTDVQGESTVLMLAFRSSLERMSARIRRDEFRLGSRILAAVERANGINPTVLLSIRAIFQEWTHVRKPAAGAAIDAMPFTIRRDRQQARHCSLELRGPSVLRIVSHLPCPTIKASPGSPSPRCLRISLVKAATYDFRLAQNPPNGDTADRQLTFSYTSSAGSGQWLIPGRPACRARTARHLCSESAWPTPALPTRSHAAAPWSS
jgi:hypothetical protein